MQEIESWRGVMHGMLHAEKYGALPRITSIHVDAEAGETHVNVENQGWGNVSTAHVQVGPFAASLPDMVPGQEVRLYFDSLLPAGEVPVQVEYKKRLHPDSNWGRSILDVVLEPMEDGDLVAVLEGPVPPSMGVLLPDPAPLLQEAPEPQVLEQASQPAPHEDSPGLFVGAMLLALVAIAARRRQL